MDFANSAMFGPFRKTFIPSKRPSEQFDWRQFWIYGEFYLPHLMSIVKKTFLLVWKTYFSIPTSFCYFNRGSFYSATHTLHFYVIKTQNLTFRTKGCDLFSNLFFLVTSKFISVHFLTNNDRIEAYWRFEYQ